MELRDYTLLRALLNTVAPRYAVAKECKLSTASLSRHSDGLLRRPSVLKTLAHFFSSRLPDDSICDADLLTQRIRAEDLIGLARKLRADALKGGA
jgi:hypothetical protein